MDFAAPFAGLSPLALTVMLLGLIAASLARGYSGFGFSALLLASWALVTDPAKAITLALLLEVTASVFQAASVWKDIPWKRVGLLIGGAVIGTPIGVHFLVSMDESLLRLVIAGFVFVMAVTLAAGFSFKTRVNDAGTASVGVASGLCNGAVGLGGLPVALFMTADGDSPRAIRATIIAYFFLLDIAGLIFMSREGLVTMETFSMGILALPVLLVGMYLGQRQFMGATPQGFRRVTLGLLILLSLLGMARAIWS
jgi:uncharacterized protein